MYDLHSLLTENTVKVEILHIESTADLSCTVIPHAWTAAAIAAVSDIDLMTVSPRSALLNVYAFEVHAAALEVALDELGERAALHECGKDLDRESEI